MVDNKRLPEKQGKPADKPSKAAAKASKSAKPSKATATAPESEGISSEQAKVYALMGDVIAKLILALAATVAFLAVTFKLISDPSWPLAAAEMVLASGVTIVFKHYFPSKEKSGRAAEKKTEKE